MRLDWNKQGTVKWLRLVVLTVAVYPQNVKIVNLEKSVQIVFGKSAVALLFYRRIKDLNLWF